MGQPLQKNGGTQNSHKLRLKEAEGRFNERSHTCGQMMKGDIQQDCKHYPHSSIFTPTAPAFCKHIPQNLYSTLLQGEHQTSKHPNIKNGRGRARTQAGEYAKPPKSRPSPCAHARRRTRSTLRTFFPTHSAHTMRRRNVGSIFQIFY